MPSVSSRRRAATKFLAFLRSLVGQEPQAAQPVRQVAERDGDAAGAGSCRGELIQPVGRRGALKTVSDDEPERTAGVSDHDGAWPDPDRRGARVTFSG